MSQPHSPLRIRLLRWSVPILAAPLAGCNWVVMNPSGDIALQQRDLILISTALMLLIVLPVMALVVVFAMRYRATNKATDADYDPDWDHSTKLELLIWSAPLLIIIALGAMTWVSTHKLDPYRPLDSDVKPIEVQVVSLDWKWLFIYPEQGIATVNELAFPVDTPVNFKITSQSAMNSFFIPALGSQIYSMAGMQTKLHLIANHEGSYDGFSANLSGEGFSDMKFQAIATDEQGFNDWVSQVKANSETLDLDSYPALAAPSKADPVRYYGSVSPTLYDTILMQYHNGGKHAAGHGDHAGHHGHEARTGAEMAGMPMNAAEETH